MEYKDYFKIMGVARDASQDEIKRFYRKLARKYIPASEWILSFAKENQ